MTTGTAIKFDIEGIRELFPAIHQEVNGKPLIYLDNAATTQKPLKVIDALSQYYMNDNANIHRGIHTLAERATYAYEETRKHIGKFINANEAEEIIFTKGTTEGINLVAQAYGRKFLKEGDEVLISGMEHHSNIVPWQMVCNQTGAKLKVIEITDEGDLDFDSLNEHLTDKTAIVSVVYISNSLGTVNPIADIIKKAHDVGAMIMIDAAQAIPHIQLDVQQLNCDFLAFSGHKMYGPTGVGVLYGKRSLLEAMDPYQGGGEMIANVTFEKTTYNDIPYKFEAGTPNIGDVIALREALRFIEFVGYDTIGFHENDLLTYATGKLDKLDSYNPVGISRTKAGVISFNIDKIHPFDLGIFLDTKGIAIRTGHHCTQPIMERYKIEGTARASLAIYNSRNDVDLFVDALEEIIIKFRRQ